jgi:PAS domain S-box-containing protein
MDRALMDLVWLSAPSPALALRTGPGGRRVQPNPAALAWAAQHGLAAEDLTAVQGPGAMAPDSAAAAVQTQVTMAGRSWPATAVLLGDGVLLWLHAAPVQTPSPGMEGLVGPAATRATAFMERALELSGVSVWRVDLAARRIHFNSVGQQRMGLGQSPAGVPLAGVRATIHPDDREAVARAAQQALAGDAVIDVRARYRNPDGSWRLLLTRRVAERDEQGQVQGLLGISLDLSEQEAQRERAEALAQRSRLVAEALEAGFWQRDPDRLALQWDEQMYRIHRRDPALGPPHGHSWVEACVHPDDRTWVMERVRRADAAWEPTTDMTYRAAQPDEQGGERWVQSWARRVTRGGQRLALGMHMDVSARFRDQAARHHERERVQVAIQVAEVGVWERDREGRIVYWNDVMYRQRGLDPADRRSLSDIADITTHPEDRAALRRMVQRHLVQGEPYRHEFRVTLPDGRARWLLSQGQTIRDGNGQVLGVTGVNLDITERRQAEALQHETQLLAEASRHKSALMARLSHELRTPMNAVLGFTRLLEDDAQAPLAPRQRDHVVRIADAGARLMALIDDVLEVATLQAQADAAPSPARALPVAELLRGVAAAIVGEAERCGVQLRWPQSSALQGVAVRADRLRAVQAVGHVLQQLLRRSPRGARLRVHVAAGEAAAGELAARAGPGPRPEGGWVDLRIRIDGRAPGAARAQPTLFGDLDGADPGDGSADSGAGSFVPLLPGQMPAADELALDLARSLLHPMGGDVHWTPDAAAGGTETLVHCTLRLPAAAALAAPLAAPAEASAGMTAGMPAARTAQAAAVPADAAPCLTTASTPAASAAKPVAPRLQVLCVEDNPVNLQLVCEVLALRPQVQLRTAVDGQTGIAAALAAPPDLLLLDLQLPDQHGIDVMRRLRQEPALRGCLFVALSADAMPEHVRAALDAGFDAYWTKPIHFERFLADIDRLAAERASARGGG